MTIMRPRMASIMRSHDDKHDSCYSYDQCAVSTMAGQRQHNLGMRHLWPSESEAATPTQKYPKVGVWGRWNLRCGRKLESCVFGSIARTETHGSSSRWCRRKYARSGIDLRKRSRKGGWEARPRRCCQEHGWREMAQIRMQEIAIHAKIPRYHKISKIKGGQHLRRMSIYVDGVAERTSLLKSFICAKTATMNQGGFKLEQCHRCCQCRCQETADASSKTLGNLIGTAASNNA